MNTTPQAALSKPALLRHPQTWLVIGLAAAYAAYFSWLTIARHQAFQSQAFDLAIFVQAFWNGLDHSFFAITAHPGVTSFWQIHFTPSMLLIEPLYALFPTPETLLVLQAVLVASGAWPIFRLAAQRLNHLGLGAVFALVYLLFPALQSANLYDFHLLTLAAPLLAWTFWFAENKQWRLYALTFAFSLGMREEVSIILLGFGLLLFTHRETRRLGLLSSLAALAWMLVLYAVQFSGASVLSSHFESRFELGATPWQALLTLTANPLIVWQRFSAPARLFYLANLFAPVAYLAFFSRRFFFLVLPTLSLHLLSTFAPLHSAAQAHYNVLLAPVIVFSAVDGVANLLGWLKVHLPRRYWSALFCLLLVGLSLGYQFRLAHLPFSPYFKAPLSLPRHTAAREIIQRIDPGSSLSAQDNLAPHTANRSKLYIFPEVGQAEFVLLDNRAIELRFNAGLPSWHQARQALRANPEYSLLIEKDGYELYSRKQASP